MTATTVLSPVIIDRQLLDELDAWLGIHHAPWPQILHPFAVVWREAVADGKQDPYTDPVLIAQGERLVRGIASMPRGTDLLGTDAVQQLRILAGRPGTGGQFAASSGLVDDVVTMLDAIAREAETCVPFAERLAASSDSRDRAAAAKAAAAVADDKCCGLCACCQALAFKNRLEDAVGEAGAGRDNGQTARRLRVRTRKQR